MIYTYYDNNNIAYLLVIYSPFAIAHVRFVFYTDLTVGYTIVRIHTSSVYYYRIQGILFMPREDEKAMCDKMYNIGTKTSVLLSEINKKKNQHIIISVRLYFIYQNYGNSRVRVYITHGSSRRCREKVEHRETGER